MSITKPVEIKVGEVPLSLTWDLRAQQRFAKYGIPTGSTSAAGAFLFGFVAAANRNPASRSLSDEDLADLVGELPEEEQEKVIADLAEAFKETKQRAESPGKKRSNSRKSSRSSASKSA